MEKKNILFVNDEMVMGGVARILCTFLKFIDKDKYNVDLLVLHKHGELLKDIPDNINVIEGSSFFNTIDIPIRECDIANILSKIRLLFYMKTGLIKNKIIKERKRTLKKQYDVEFSAKEGFCTIFTAFGDSLKKLNWIQTDYKVNNFSSNHMKLVKNALSYIDMNIACSNQVSDSFKEVFGVNNIITIHNLVDEEKIREMSCEPCNDFNSNKIKLITVARFHSQKRIDRLIKAYARNKENYSLTIVGDGELYGELTSLSKMLGVYEDINWTGILSNPYPLIKKSDLFIMSSLYEGYPTITIESLISGTPVLTTEVAGVREQIVDSNGWVIDNDDLAITKFLGDFDYLKTEIIKKKQNLVDYHYDNKKIMDEYYKLFDN